MSAWSMALATPRDESRTVVGAELADELVAIGRSHGLAAVGVTDAEVFTETLRDLLDRRRQGLQGNMQFTYRNPERSTDPRRVLPGARSLVVGAWGYRREDLGEQEHESPQRPRARVARYAQRDHYASLRLALTAVADRLKQDGWRATVVCDDNALVDRAAAHRAGLGWFGKNSLLLLPGLGSWFVLGSVVTDAPLGSEPDPGPERTTSSAPTSLLGHGSGCGSCARCMSACPTGALVSPGVVDARRCLAWLVQAPGSFPAQFRDALGDRIYGCDECQSVCPINRVAERRDPPPPMEPDGDAEAGVDLLGLLASSDADLLDRHGRWYIADREPRYLRRNALVALGNVGEGSDPDTEAALRRALDDPDPMITEHATWAAHKLGRDDLVTRVGGGVGMGIGVALA
ncbi:MAG TPA: tRNA epoxyqueuosine(34) reductase QueG [Acidimicrobiales bacterium]|nr:tRNA epoxyqueuosine(34) reductase QueG [Acidimicrobiales bacterium]